MKNFKICEDLDDCLNQLLENSKLAVAISREHAFNTAAISHIYCFENSEIIYEYALTILVRKDFSYLKELNWFIEILIESGYISKWLTDYQNQSHFKSKHDIYRPTELKHMHGILSILMIVIIVAFAVLLLEKTVYKKTKQQNPSKFWIIIEIMIDPDRHFMLENKMI